MLLRFFLITLVSLITLNTGFSQRSKQARKLEKDAAEFYELEEYFEALQRYLRLDTLEPDQAQTKYRIGECYMHSHTKIKSLPYFKKAQELNYKDVKLNYFLGRAYHLNHHFDESEKFYKTYQSQMKDSSRIVEEMSRYLEQCKVGRALIADSSLLEIENLGEKINSRFPDYVPVISADETVMIFTSRRENSSGGRIDPTDGFCYEDLYSSNREAEGWSTPINLGEPVNTKLHDACIGLSPDGQKLFIYRARPGKRNSGDIFVSNLEGSKWSSPVKMGSPINSDSWEPSATITADEKTIYFSSDRPGGLGGTDIYYSRLQENGEWGEALNLGPGINTPYDDDAPYIHPDGKTLYFSSRGHRNMGGFDIFSTVYDAEKNQWSEPQNAGYPINTSDDDIYFIWSADGTKGYFSSWRHDSYGDKDLYVIHGPKKGVTNLTVLKGKVVNAASSEPVASTITLTDNETQKVLGVYNSNSLTGKYTIVLPHGKNYAVTVEAEGHMFHSENVNIEKQGPFFEMSKDILIQPIRVGNKIVLKNIFFDFDRSTLRNESASELEKLYRFLCDHPDLQVEISGHTDSMGNDKYNERLSKARAHAVLDYLTEKGIAKKRLIAKGYGRKQPLAPNSTAEGRQINRRTEFKITGANLEALSIRYEMGDSGLKPYDDSGKRNSQSKMNHVGNLTANNSRSMDDHNILPAPTVSSSDFAHFESGYILKAKVHFTYNTSESMTEFSTQRVNYVVELMKQNPSLKIRIRAHSDHLGNREYNRHISEKRAQTVYNYMVSQGIDESRLEIKAFGADQELVHDETTKGNLENRRVEFEVISIEH